MPGILATPTASARTRAQAAALAVNKEDSAQEKEEQDSAMDEDEEKDETEEESGDDDEEEEESAESDSDDEGSEYGSKKKATRKAPAAKRAKTDHSLSESPTKSNVTKMGGKQKKKKKGLSILSTMPLDVLFEIFGHLTPLDVLRIARSSKIFRETLMARNSTSVWKAARRNVNAPPPPEWFSEPRWAALLFGNICQSCGATNIQKVDFLILRRVCTACKKDHLMVTSKVRTKRPDVEESLLTLLHHTNVGGFAHGHASSSQFYWDDDIDQMQRRLAELEHKIHMRAPNARQALETFKATQQRNVEFIQENYRTWDGWHYNQQQMRSENNYDSRERRKSQIIERFLELGYAEEDLSFLSRHKDSKNKAPLTDLIWKRLRPELEPEAVRRRSVRLERDSAKLRMERRGIVDRLYTAYKLTLHPSQWRYLPRTLDITFLEPFKVLVEAPIEELITTESFKEPFDMLGELLAARAEERRTRLKGLLPVSDTKDGGGGSGGGMDTNREPEPEEGEIISAPSVAQASSTATQDPVDLATAAFKCTLTHRQTPHYPFLFGSDEVAAHHCTSQKTGLATQNTYSCSFFSMSIELVLGDDKDLAEALKVVYDQKAAQLVRKILGLLKVGDKSVMAADLDAKDCRFGCVDCVPGYIRGSKDYGRMGFTWRGLVAHLAENDTHNPRMDVFLLSPEDTLKIKAAEMIEKAKLANTNLWTCAHCTEYHASLSNRTTVVLHLQNSHAIVKPVEPTDLFLFERFRSAAQSSDKTRYSVPAPAGVINPFSTVMDIRCLKCGGNRKFSIVGVKDHLRAKHKVLNPLNGVDYGAH